MSEQQPILKPDGEGAKSSKHKCFRCKLRGHKARECPTTRDAVITEEVTNLQNFSSDEEGGKSTSNSANCGGESRHTDFLQQEEEYDAVTPTPQHQTTLKQDAIRPHPTSLREPHPPSPRGQRSLQFQCLWGCINFNKTTSSPWKQKRKSQATPDSEAWGMINYKRMNSPSIPVYSWYGLIKD